MILKVFGFESELLLGGVGSLVIKDGLQYRRIIESLFDYDENNVLSIENQKKFLTAKKDILVVNDVYGFDFSSRQILSALYKQLATQKDERSVKLVVEIENRLAELMNIIELTSDINFNYETQLDLADLFKLAKVSLEVSTSKNYIDKIYAIIDIANNLMGRRVVVLVHQREFLANNEIRALLNYLLDQKISVLFIEKSLDQPIAGENCLVIDEDLYDFSTFDGKR